MDTAMWEDGEPLKSGAAPDEHLKVELPALPPNAAGRPRRVVTAKCSAVAVVLVATVGMLALFMPGSAASRGRRRLAEGTGTGTVHGQWWWGDEPEETWVPLKQLSQNSGVLLGSIHNEDRVWLTEGDAEVAKYEKLLADNFDLITPENACKAATLFPEPSSLDNPRFETCDRIFDWAHAQGLKVRFHVAAWGDWNPDWMVDTPPAQKAALLERTVEVALAHYADHPALLYVDVVNEAVCDDVVFTPDKQNCGNTEAAGLLKGGPGISSWYPDVPNYIDLAFHTARRVLAGRPEVKLVYNDYNFESQQDPVDRNKAERVYEFVAAAVARGVPIDVIGLQAHLSAFHAGSGIVGGLLFRQWLAGVPPQLKRFADLGLEVHFTELDVGCNFPTLPCPPSVPLIADSGDEHQADVYAGLLEACLQEPACTVFQMWGSTDRYSWRDGSWTLDGGGTGDESKNQRAHIFDAESFAPKESAWALARTLQGLRS